MPGATNNSLLRQCTKILGIGRNYKLHAAELGNAVPQEPFFFLKPPSSLLLEPGSIEIPKGAIVHHEVEVGVIIGTGGRDILEAHAMKHVGAYCLALDLTARNLQDEAKRKSYPWTIAKGYDTFCPVSAVIPAARIPHPDAISFNLSLDGRIVQRGHTRDMVFSVPQLIAFVSTIMRLEPGDILLTGTPQGVGPIAPGQKLTGTLSYGGRLLVDMQFPVIPRPAALRS
jgi:acylpyruvate hydrolase